MSIPDIVTCTPVMSRLTPQSPISPTTPLLRCSGVDVITRGGRGRRRSESRFTFAPIADELQASESYTEAENLLHRQPEMHGSYIRLDPSYQPDSYYGIYVDHDPDPRYMNEMTSFRAQPLEYDNEIHMQHHGEFLACGSILYQQCKSTKI